MRSEQIAAEQRQHAGPHVDPRQTFVERTRELTAGTLHTLILTARWRSDEAQHPRQALEQRWLPAFDQKIGLDPAAAADLGEQIGGQLQLRDLDRRFGVHRTLLAVRCCCSRCTLLKLCRLPRVRPHRDGCSLRIMSPAAHPPGGAAPGGQTGRHQVWLIAVSLTRFLVLELYSAVSCGLWTSLTA